MTYNLDTVRDDTILDIGIQGEDNARQVKFDISAWLAAWPGGTIEIQYKRPEDTGTYDALPSKFSVVDGILTWIIDINQTVYGGYGYAIITYRQGGVVRKSPRFNTLVKAGLPPAGPAPDAVADWIAEANAALNAIETLEFTINDNGELLAGETVLGRVSDNPRGDYNPGADPLYSKRDVVFYNGGSYRYINDTPSNEPTSSTSHWQQIAQKGDTGPSAYDAAVTAGYTGTEAEFNAANAGIEAAKDAALGAAEEASAFGDNLTAMSQNAYSAYDNIIDWSKINHQQYYETPAYHPTNDGYWNTGKRRVDPSTEYVVFSSRDSSNIYATRVVFLTQGGALISSVSNVVSFTTPATAYYVVISFRYKLSGVLGVYSTGIAVYGISYDDNINVVVINKSNAGAKVQPYPYRFSAIEPKNEVSVSNRVVSIRDGKRGKAAVKISRSAFSGTIQICVCGSNVFDGITQSGYYGADGTVQANAGFSCSVNPIYVNEDSYIVTSKNCRVTEFDSAGDVNYSALAEGRYPYRTRYGTKYIHIHSEIANMIPMYVNLGGKITDAAETFSRVKKAEAVRTWGPTIYDVEIDLLDGVNNVYIESALSHTITLVYPPNLVKKNDDDLKYRRSVDDLAYMRGVKMAGNAMAVAHRGSNYMPENTTPAFVQAFLDGFKAVEGDLRFTSDNVPVMLHDSTIDRTSTGTGAISSLTYAQASAYNYGSWLSSKYNTPSFGLAKFDSFLDICSTLGMMPMIDSKAGTVEQAEIAYDLVEKYGLEESACWVFSNFDDLNTMLGVYTAKGDKKMSFTFIPTGDPVGVIDSLDWFKNTSSHPIREVGISLTSAQINSTVDTLCKEKNLFITAYSFDTHEIAKGLFVYKSIRYFTTDTVDPVMAFCQRYYPFSPY